MAGGCALIDLPSSRPDRVRCVMSLRGEGCGRYGGFNACHYVGDSTQHVVASRRLLAERLGIDEGRLVIPRQTHSCNVAVVRGADGLSATYDDIDALVTDQIRVALCINTADCVPVVLYDAVNGVVGIAHSGWRGTVGRIAVRTFDAMLSLGAEVQHVYVYTGASICCDCFEVGEEVAQKFRDAFPDDNGAIVRGGYPRPHVDLKAAIRRTLVEAGVDSLRIADMGICSRCGELPLFSARRDGIESGRTLTSVMLV